MNTRSLLVVAGLAFATMAGASSAGAAPVGALTGAADTDSFVVKVHGCHRSCEWGPVLRWHRHIGPACRPVGCWPRAARPNRCWVDWRGIRHCRW
jgi:hypothetical protein